MIDILSPEEIARGIPECVYIVGSGPNGRDYWHQIPVDAHVIVVNKAVIIEGIPKTWWLCEDDTLPDQKWFVDCVQKVQKPLRIFRRCGRMQELFPSKYVFTHDAIWRTACRKYKGKPKFQAPLTYGGATISCRALQIAAMRGAKEIILVGVDMSNSLYFDGTEGDCEKEVRRKGEWKQVKVFNQIIRWVIFNTDVKVRSLSETALNVESPSNPQAAISRSRGGHGATLLDLTKGL